LKLFVHSAKREERYQNRISELESEIKLLKAEVKSLKSKREGKRLLSSSPSEECIHTRRRVHSTADKSPKVPPAHGMHGLSSDTGSSLSGLHESTEPPLSPSSATPRDGTKARKHKSSSSCSSQEAIPPPPLPYPDVIPPPPLPTTTTATTSTQDAIPPPPYPPTDGVPATSD